MTGQQTALIHRLRLSYFDHKPRLWLRVAELGNPGTKILTMPKWHRSYTRETPTAAHEQYSKCKLPHVQLLLGGERAALCRH